jgi:hypothetical protein
MTARKLLELAICACYLLCFDVSHKGHKYKFIVGRLQVCNQLVLELQSYRI